MRAEIENSSLQDCNQFTICGRFRTPFLPGMLKNMTIQTLMYSGKMWFLNSIEMRDCETDIKGVQIITNTRLVTLKHFKIINHI